jgi:hypothetical protein
LSTHGDAFVYRQSHCGIPSISQLYLYDGELKTFQEIASNIVVPVKYQVFDSIQFISTWSPDHQHGVFINDERDVLIYSTAIKDFVVIEDVTQFSDRVSQISIYWLDLAQFILITEGAIFRCDLSTCEVGITIFGIEGSDTISADRRYLLFGNDMCDGACILDLSTWYLNSISIEVPEGWEGHFYFEETVPHPSDKWTFFLSKRTGRVATVYLADWNGETIREIGTLDITKSSFGWLPPIRPPVRFDNR